MNIIPDPAPEALQNALDGDADALNALLSDISRPVYRFCLSLLADPAQAEDAAQDVLVKICSSLDEFEGRSKFSTWVYRVASNRCMDLLRRKKSRPEDSLDALIEAGNGVDCRLLAARSPDDTAALADKLLVASALARLEPEQRAIIVLREISGLAYDEIGAALNLPEGTVKSRLFRAREELLLALQALNPSEHRAVEK
ncbi:MAG: RNA polymerase sigma factor [Elusimicrobiales bacterium]|nr:RNA polymerase sigma factor [Elusimicrobiales bacterium]